MARNKDISHLIEHLEAFEDRLGVSLEGLYASASMLGDTDFITVSGEVHPREGTQLTRDIEVVVSLHDSNGRVLSVGDERISAAQFFGFEAFSETLGPVDNSVIAKIRVYPKAR